ncbi:MAG: hypothetical protein B6242_09385 [Anaerolineaceae bacterium 4572_78]|nr:MAG: hypothetical protein B6242_09385 [Anaerolineaceae bacterium 4572_78]
MDNIPTNTAMLIWQEGELIKDQWMLDKNEIFLGRSDSCQICLPSRWISRQHACIRRNGTIYTAQDAGSKNGLYVNGNRVYKKHILADGDKLQLAPGLDLTFVDSEATAPLPGRIAELLRLDDIERQVYIKGEQLTPSLSTQQYHILTLLFEHPGKVYSRYEVIKAAWPDDNAEGVSDDAVDAMIRRLRNRLSEIDPDHNYVVTVRGYGFKLNLKQE